MINSLVVLSIIIPLYLLFNQRVPELYMDEIFHYRQTINFINSNYTWDPKITTPPFLYVLLSIPGVDLDLSQMRLVVLAMGYMRAVLLGSILEGGEWLVFFPVQFMFDFLFYTDSLSTLLVLAGVYSKKGRIWLLVMSVMTRQTNIIWLVYVAGLDVLNNSDGISRVCNGLSLIEAVDLVGKLIYSTWRRLGFIIRRQFLYILATASFILFAYWNGGIALGDKSNHIVSLHFAQLLYFAAFTAFFSIPLLYKEIFSTIRLMVAKWRLTTILMLLAAHIVHNHTIIHPFLLADNRHFSFYIVRYLLKPSLIRYILVPGYVSCFFLIYNKVKGLPFLSMLLYCISVTLALVPSPLIEFRYYLLPYYIIRLQMGRVTKLEILWYTVINILVFYTFLEKGFLWEGTEVIQRFMW